MIIFRAFIFNIYAELLNKCARSSGSDISNLYLCIISSTLRRRLTCGGWYLQGQTKRLITLEKYRNITNKLTNHYLIVFSWPYYKRFVVPMCQQLFYLQPFHQPMVLQSSFDQLVHVI